MLTRRAFLIGSGFALAGCDVLARRLLTTMGGGGSFAPPPPVNWQITGAAATEASLSVVYAAAAMDVTVGGSVVEHGYQPDAAGTYGALWTRDHAYVLWHNPTLLTAAQRRQFVTHRLATRTTASTPDPNGGTFPADFIADRIAADGTVTYLNTGASIYGNLPIFDGIAMVVLALWADWNLTGDTTTFTASQAVIDACLAAIPRSVNGCVWSDPASPSVDYGFTDSILKTGDVAYGTALQAWAYKMCAEMAGELGSGTYTTLRAAAEAGLATLRQGSGWYKGSSGNNAARDDVWATALIVAEGLVSGTDRTDSATTIANSYASGSMGAFGWTSPISQYGLVRHLPVGQYWAGTAFAHDAYQNGAYWLTPLWDCVRAVALVDPTLALTWAAEAMQQVIDENTAEANWLRVPYEWHNHGVGVGVKGCTASAAVVRRFA